MCKDKSKPNKSLSMLWYVHTTSTVFFVMSYWTENKSAWCGQSDVTCKTPMKMRPFTQAKISRLSWDGVQDSVFTLGHPKTKPNSSRLSFGVRLSTAHIPLYVICCLEHRAVVWKYSRQMTCLQQWWFMVQMTDVNAPAHSQPKPVQVWAPSGL